MVSFRASADEDTYNVYNAGESEFPAVQNEYIGAAFENQTGIGSYHTDAIDDRVNFLADSDTGQIYSVSFSLGQDTDDTGFVQVYGGTSLFEGHTLGDKQDNWYSTLRPEAGFPLPAVADIVYANATGDMAGDTVNDIDDELLSSGVRYIDEKPLQLVYRRSEFPAEIQHERPWDITMGAWPWTGDKIALQRPAAAVPMQFYTPVEDAIPSPTGTNVADFQSTTNMEPTPVTYRFVPSPWDTSNDGNYVDSGV